MENISDEFAFFKSSVVVVVVRCNHLAEMVSVTLNEHLAFIVFIRERETTQSCSDFKEIQIFGFIQQIQRMMTSKNLFLYYYECLFHQQEWFRRCSGHLPRTHCTFHRRQRNPRQKRY